MYIEIEYIVTLERKQQFEKEEIIWRQTSNGRINVISIWSDRGSANVCLSFSCSKIPVQDIELLLEI